MDIFATIKEGLQIARTSKSLWVFGFFVGLGSSGSGGAQPGVPPPGGIPADGSVLPQIAFVVAIIAIFMAIRILSEGALIEGVSRARRNEVLRVREGIREGMAHWGTMFVIGVIYLMTVVASVALLAAPGVIAASLIGIVPAVVMFGIPAALFGIPWLLTLYIWQAFATRIAVLENRRARDAIRKARLFLHGRLWEGLKLMIASFLGTLFASVAAFLVIAPFVVLVAVVFSFGGGPTAIVLSLPVLVPAVLIAVAIIGTFRSSIWTIGYLTQVEVSS